MSLGMKYERAINNHNNNRHRRDRTVHRVANIKKKKKLFDRFVTVNDILVDEFEMIFIFLVFLVLNILLSNTTHEKNLFEQFDIQVNQIF